MCSCINILLRSEYKNIFIDNKNKANYSVIFSYTCLLRDVENYYYKSIFSVCTYIHYLLSYFWYILYIFIYSL